MFEYVRAFGRLNRDVKFYLAGNSLIAFAYFGIMGVLFNLYLVRLGFGAEFIGLLIGSGQLIWAILALPAGAIGLRLGLKRVLVLAQVLAALGFSLVLLVEWLPRAMWEGWLIGGWMILWVGAALLTVNSVPFLMAATSSGERGYAFSLQAALTALITIVGSLVAGWLPGVLAVWMDTTLDGSPMSAAPYRLALWLAPASFVLAALFFGAMRPVEIAVTKEGSAQRSGAPIALFLFFTVMVFLAACGEGAVRSFFTLYLDGELHVATAQIGAAMGLAQMLPVFMALLTPLLMARLGTGMTLAAATVACALSITLIGVVSQWMIATVALMGLQATIAVINPTRNLFSQEIVSARWGTTTSALATIGVALGWAVAAALGGYAIAAVGYRVFFLACSSLVMASALLLLLYLWRTKVAVNSRAEDAQVAGD